MLTFEGQSKGHLWCKLGCRAQKIAKKQFLETQLLIKMLEYNTTRCRYIWAFGARWLHWITGWGSAPSHSPKMGYPKLLQQPYCNLNAGCSTLVSSFFLAISTCGIFSLLEVMRHTAPFAYFEFCSLVFVVSKLFGCFRGPVYHFETDFAQRVLLKPNMF